MTSVKIGWGAGVICALMMAGGVQGVSVMFQDDFESETRGSATSLTKWLVTRGDVNVLDASDVAPLTAVTGKTIDLAGDLAAGRMESKQEFTLTPGLYTLSFDIAGSQRATSPLDVVRVLFGDQLLITSTRGYQDAFQGITVQINPTVTTTGRIVFDQQADNGAASQGALIDNVVLREYSAAPGPTPIPVPAAAWTGLVTMAGLGVMGVARRLGRG